MHKHPGTLGKFCEKQSLSNVWWLDILHRHGSKTLEISIPRREEKPPLLWAKNDLLNNQKTQLLDLQISENRGTPKSSILIAISIINHPFWGFYPYFLERPKYQRIDRDLNLQNPLENSDMHPFWFIAAQPAPSPPNVRTSPRNSRPCNQGLMKTHGFLLIFLACKKKPNYFSGGGARLYSFEHFLVPGT